MIEGKAKVTASSLRTRERSQSEAIVSSEVWQQRGQHALLEVRLPHGTE